MHLASSFLNIHEPVLFGGQISMILAGLTVAIGLTVFKKWKWLWNNWLTTLDPKRIGVMYLFVATIMLLRGFGDAVMMRAQQAIASGNSGFLSSEHFQQVFTAHGTIMIFFVAMGLMFGLINLVLPLQLGARDVAFPFINSLSFWMYAGGAILINLSLLVGGEFAATGWLAYPPLSELQFSPGPGVDYWIWSVQIAGIGSLLSGINFILTILKMRAPSMPLKSMPMFSWSVLGSMILVVATFPILTVTLALLSLDRTMGMHFFTTDAGGNAMMYVNLIWAWGHPEVYILVLPAFGIFSEIVATFSKKRLFGYMSMVWAIMAIAFFSYVVWLHHFFTMGAGANVNTFFSIMTMIIAIPTGVKVFNWLFTMYRGRITLASPMIWFLGFIATFTVGGVTGVMLALPAIDFQVHNSLFLVAHFHNMIIGGVVFGFFAGITYWFPKIFGFTLNERLGKMAAYCWIIGFLVAFVPLYALGLMGATRRLDHYDPSLGWQGLFIVSAVGAMIIATGIALQLLQVGVSVWKRNENRDTSGDPWDGRTLEWSTPSPAPEYNFARIPEASKRDAFWEAKTHPMPKKTLPAYKPIKVPKNTPLALYIAGFSLFAGFSIIWHAYGAMLIGLLGVCVCVFMRAMETNTEKTIPVQQIKKIEGEATA